MITVITFTRVSLWFVLFSFCILISLYSCGAAKEVSEKRENQNNLDGYSNIVQEEDTKFEATHGHGNKDKNINSGDIKKGLDNSVVEVLKPTPIKSISESEIDFMEHCKDYDQYYQIHVDKVLSDHVVRGYCGKTPISVQYAGIKSLENKGEIFEKAIALNNFLVSNKEVILRAYEKRFDQGVIHVLGEIFVEGESVTIRLISTGLVILSPSDAILDRMEVFIEINEKFKKYHGANSKNNENQDGEKEAVPPIGCGTLPCKP